MDVKSRGTRPLAERYRDRLPIDSSTPIVSLGEGGTPLLHASHLSKRLGIELWLKFDGANPTGSFKDRGMTVAVSKALQEGVRAVICASTGNTAASMAAYAARCGLTAVVLIPDGAIAAGKLAQSQALGARVLAVQGSFDEALRAAQVLADRGEFALVNSVNPNRIEGQKTAAFEIVEELGGAPEFLALPYGGGGNTTAYAKGFVEAGAGLPQLLCCQAEDRPRTRASAIRIADPVHAHEVAEALELCGGTIATLSDDQILAAWKQLAHGEGLFCEPASAAGIAGLIANPPAPGTPVVCVVTGHGLKDPAIAAELSPDPIPVDPDPDAIAAAAT